VSPVEFEPESRTSVATIPLSSSVSSREQLRWLDEAIV
jgi:hypothetical protein